MVDCLIDAGHYWPGENEPDNGIRGYTLEQVERFAVAFTERQARQRAISRADSLEDTVYAISAALAKPAQRKELIRAYRQAADDE